MGKRLSAADSFCVKNKHPHETLALGGFPSDRTKPTSHLPGNPNQTRFSAGTIPEVETNIMSQPEACFPSLPLAAFLLEEL